ncbi:MAG: O-antigen ligase family protein [Elusimicrobia bacterium]|nr:O-antigen ligase family protein [Elusimicrobiota bacterium]
MEIIFNYLFSIIEQFGQDGYKILLAVYFLLMYKYWKLFIKEKILLSTIIFILYGLILSCFCIDKNRAFYEMLGYIFGWTLPYFLGYTLLTKHNKEKIVFITMAIFAAFIFVGLFSYYGLLPEKFWGIRFCEYNQLRICTFRVTFAAKATFMFIISSTLLLFYKNSSKFAKFWLCIFTVLFFIAILLSGSRIYYGVTALISFFIFIFYTYKTKKVKPILYFSLTAVICCSYVYFSNPNIKKRIHVTSTTKDISIVTRINMHKYAIDSFKKHPLFGLGPSQSTIQEEFSKIEKEKDKEQWHLHSIYLDTLSDFGLTGLLLFLIIIFLVIKNLFIIYNQYNSAFVLALIFAWIAILIGDYVDTVLADPFLSSLYFWFTGIALSKQKEENN